LNLVYILPPCLFKSIILIISNLIHTNTIAEHSFVYCYLPTTCFGSSIRP
jgi:hypothetical protein